MKRIGIAFVALVCLVAAACNTNSKDAITLKLNLKQGDKFEQEIATAMSLTQKSMGQDAKLNNNMAFTYVFEALSDSAGWTKMGSTINHIIVEMSGVGGKEVYDSNNTAANADSTDMMAKLFGTMKGSSFSFTVNDKGEIGRVEGLEEMQRKMGEAIPGETGEAAGDKIYNEQSFKENIQQSFAAYPEKPVKPGDSWNKSMLLRSEGMTIQSDNVYTLESVQGNKAIIKVTAKLSSAAQQMAPGTEVEVSGNSNGTLEYDIPTGMPVSGNIDMLMNMTMKSQGTQVPMSVNMKTTIKGRKV
jgi:hypothetical protein